MQWPPPAQGGCSNRAPCACRRVKKRRSTTRRPGSRSPKRRQGVLGGNAGRFRPPKTDGCARARWRPARLFSCRRASPRARPRTAKIAPTALAARQKAKATDAATRRFCAQRGLERGRVARFGWAKSWLKADSERSLSPKVARAPSALSRGSVAVWSGPGVRLLVPCTCSHDRRTFLSPSGPI